MHPMIVPLLTLGLVFMASCAPGTTIPPAPSAAPTAAPTLAGPQPMTTPPVTQTTALPAASVTPTGGDLLPTRLYSPTASLDRAFELNMFQRVWIPEAQMYVTLNGLLEESRCPRSVNCVQAGRAVLGFMIERNERVGFFSLSTMPPDGRQRGFFQGYLVELRDVQPYPQTPDPVPPRDYHVTLILHQAAPPTSANKNEPLVLHVGQTGRLTDESLDITLVRIRQDSRCPYMATCAIRGDGVVEALLKQADGTTQTFVLHTDSAASNERIPDNGPYAMELLALNPYPRADVAGKDITPEEYEATLVLRKFAPSRVPLTTTTPVTPQACLGLTAQDAQAVLGEPVQATADPHVRIYAEPFDELSRRDDGGICGYLSAAGNLHQLAAPGEPRVSASFPALHAFAAARLTGMRMLEIVRVANLLRGAAPGADATPFHILQTQIAAGMDDEVLDRLEALARGSPQVHTARTSAGDQPAFWIWRQSRTGNYGALLIPNSNDFYLLEALVSAPAPEAGVREAILALVPKLTP